MRMVPTVNNTGTRLFVAADGGKVFCLDTAVNPPQRLIWQYPPSSSLTHPVRSGIAYDPVAPQAGGGTEEAVYFQANNGYTYSLNAVTGALRWLRNTGNVGGPPPSWEHDTTWSSTPAIGREGLVYVGSANGYLYCLNPTNGQIEWALKLNASNLIGPKGEPVESTPAIGENGWIYVATRYATLGEEVAYSHVYAVDPAGPTIRWFQPVTFDTWGSPETVGVIAGLVVDQTGAVYVPAFHSTLHKYDGCTGDWQALWLTEGKLCQTPALNQSGMLILGTSVGFGGVRSVRGLKVFPKPNPNADWASLQWTASGGASGEFGDFLGGALIRADGSGTAYVADADTDAGTGAVYQFVSGSSSMPGDWPTMGSGNRRHHKARSYPYQLVELGPFPAGVAESCAAFDVDVLGRVVGYAHGRPGYPYYSLPQDWYGAHWGLSGSPSLLGNYATALPRHWAQGINLNGIVVGYSTYVGPYGPIVWTSLNYTPQLLPLPQGYYGGQARDITEDNAIIGFSDLGYNNPRVIRWDWTGSSWLEWPIGAPTDGKAQAFAISGGLRICGKAVFTQGGPWLGFTSLVFVNDFSAIQSLGTFGGTSSEAWDVHDASGTVGWAHKWIAGANYPRAFLVPPEVYTLAPAHELPGFAGQSPTGTWRSFAYGVNGCAQVVGSAQSASGPYRAFLWQPGWASLQDLTDRVGLSGWVLTSAAAISDAGHIVGTGTKNGASRQWLIYPLPQE